MLLTKGPRRLPYAWTGKKLWVDSNLGKENDLNIVSDKGKFYGRVLVDDWREYVTAWLRHRPRGLVIMPANKSNKGFSHPQVIRYDGTNLEEVRKALIRVRKTAELRRVGLLGGAFDPCHIGHLKLAEAVLKAGAVDEVWLLPCKAHLYGKAMEPYFHRLRMCELMVGNSPDIKVSDYEGIRGLSGSTLETFTRLKEEPWSKGIIEYSCIIGLDNANTMDKWVKHEALTSQVRFVVVKRQGLKKVRGQWYTKPPHEFIDEDIPGVSSTEARKFLKAWWRSKKTKVIPDGLLHCQVMAYIEKNRLYRPMGMAD